MLLYTEVLRFSMTQPETKIHDVDIAVVMVSYKSAQVALESLASIQSEKEAARSVGGKTLSIRVVVVDNASGDLPQIEQIVQRNNWSSWVTPVLAPRNGGFAYGNNIGIRCAYERSRPDYIFLLNPDTQVRPRAISALVDFLESHPQVGIAGSSFEDEEGKDWPYAFRFPSVLSEIERGIQFGLVTRCLAPWVVARTMTPVAQQVDWVSGASVMIRPSVLAAVGSLDENFFLYFEETEFCHRARRAGFGTWYVPESRVMHMIGKSTNVTQKSRFSVALPQYWFDSRRRYYSTTGRMRTAVFTDIAAIASSLLGLLKSKILRRPSTPRYIRDLWAHSVVFRRNRSIAPLKTYFPPA
jgi:N-acetylglucosaminyl-diphospho-decaprenol L-rhamnosyltransferase